MAIPLLFENALSLCSCSCYFCVVLSNSVVNSLFVTCWKKNSLSPHLALKSPPCYSDVLGPVFAGGYPGTSLWIFQVKESAYKRQFNSSLLVTRGLNSESCPGGVLWCVCCWACGVVCNEWDSGLCIVT